MKKKINILICLAVFMIAISSCKKNDGPSVDDHFMNYEIPEVPVTEDYVVGAFYYSFGTFHANVKETPTLGKYASPSGQIPLETMHEHIEMASRGGIDYFLFSLRSASRETNNFKNDSVLVSRFVESNIAGKMRFAIAYNFSDGPYGINAGNVLEDDATKLEQFINDISAFAPYFQDANYMKTNGKTLLYILNAHRIFSNDNKAIYDAVRTRLSEWGFELYIVGMQDRWTPPARYPFRYQGGVDAIFHQSFVSGLGSWDRYYLLPQAIDQNWQYSRKYFNEQVGVDYVPNISPAYTALITNPNSTNPVVGRTDNGDLYKKLCNVAKMNASSQTRLILIDSWNKWDEDLQLEPAESYGELYLNITRSQFKR